MTRGIISMIDVISCGINSTIALTISGNATKTCSTMAATAKINPSIRFGITSVSRLSSSAGSSCTMRMTIPSSPSTNAEKMDGRPAINSLRINGMASNTAAMMSPMPDVRDRMMAGRASTIVRMMSGIVVRTCSMASTTMVTTSGTAARRASMICGTAWST